MKKWFNYIAIFAISFSALALMLYCLETYTPHNESGLLVCGYSILAFIISTVIWSKKRKNNRGFTAIWIISTIILMFVFHVGIKIPF